MTKVTFPLFAPERKLLVKAIGGYVKFGQVSPITVLALTIIALIINNNTSDTEEMSLEEVGLVIESLEFVVPALMGQYDEDAAVLSGIAGRIADAIEKGITKHEQGSLPMLPGLTGPAVVC